MRDTYGPEAWRTTVECGNLPVAQFEAMLSYFDALTSQTLEANARHLDKPQAVLLEDIGTYFAFHPNVEALRRLLRFGGADFIEFLNSLDDLPDRARLAVDDLELPELFLVQLTEGDFRLVCRAKLPVGACYGGHFTGDSG